MPKVCHTIPTSYISPMGCQYQTLPEIYWHPLFKRKVMSLLSTLSDALFLPLALVGIMTIVSLLFLGFVQVFHYLCTGDFL